MKEEESMQFRYEVVEWGRGGWQLIGRETHLTMMKQRIQEPLGLYWLLRRLREQRKISRGRSG